MHSLKDRGNKKWTALMLPEHVEMLKEAFEEDEYVEKPILDEQQKMENDLMLQAALHNDLTVEIKYYIENNFKTAEGKVLFIDNLGRFLRLEYSEYMEEINLTDIIDIQVK